MFRQLGGPSALAAVLHTDDAVELALRRLSSYVYYQRTRGRTGATHMLGVIPPGASVDIANANGDTPLMLSAGKGHLEVVRYLAGATGT